ncbi:hypothetical protein DM01DRAFT_1049007 [Hesseltinella vesiculosa]|uniref:Uncharacterized protein n=1 Tax=Hesseltinella vesiculosa TaxID=101127 RepID=A0A1X2GHE6_9FUNG|nr:hypothetical protein DM01DRAFT_1049007 [Hesseltinella vesiculosa]
MDPSDAFSETLNKHPRKQKRSSKALDHQEVLGHHRLSQSLEPDGVSLPKKPAVPRKPPSLKSRPNVSSSKAPLLAALTLPDDTTDAQDEAFSFNDIRARFEQKQDSPQPFSAYQPRAVKARQGPIPPEKRRWGPPSIPSRPSSAIISQLADRLDQATLSPPHPATSPSTPALPMEAVQQPPLAFSPKPPPPPLSKRPSLHLSQSGDTLSLDAFTG